MLDKCSIKILLLLIIILLTNATYAGNKSALEQQINKAIVEEQLIGIVWSTVTEGDVNIGSSGFSNKSENIIMNHSQKMHVGSIAKTVLAFGALRLISEGKLTLDTKVASLLPTIAFQNQWEDTAPIIVQNLLEHTAGLDNIRMWQFLNTQSTPDTPLHNAFPPNNNKLLKVRTKPGSQYSYSNMSYTLLAMVIEAVSKMRYEELLEQSILEPLGMKSSTFHYVSQTGQYADKSLAMGYFEKSVPQSAVPNYLRSAGQFTTTAPDMAKFIQFIFNDGILNDKVFIQPKLMQMIGYSDQTHAHKAGLKIGHGLVFAVRDRHNVVGMCHPGTTFGFRANICLFPKQKKAFFYSINTDSETADYERFNKIFIKFLSIKKSSIVQADVQKIDLSTLEGLYLPSPNNMAEFEWLDLVFNFKWLTGQESTLLMKSLQGKDKILIPLNPTLLRATDRTQASHAIIKDDNGDVYISDGLSTYKLQPTAIIIAYWISLLLGILGLIYIILSSIPMIFNNKIARHNAILLPFINILLLSLPIYLYTQQSFLNFGELTAASFLMAVISGFLPISVLFALFFTCRKNVKNKWQKWDYVALFMSLQLCLVLIYWDVLPVIFWR